MYSDAIAHKMVPAIAETHKMVPVKTVFDAHLHVSFPIHYQIDASMHKVVPVAGIVAQKWYRLWYQQKITQKINAQILCKLLIFNENLERAMRFELTTFTLAR